MILKGSQILSRHRPRASQILSTPIALRRLPTNRLDECKDNVCGPVKLTGPQTIGNESEASRECLDFRFGNERS